MAKILSKLFLLGSIALASASCQYDSLVEKAVAIPIKYTNDEIKVYNFINEGKYDSAKLFLNDKLNKYLLQTSEVKGLIQGSDVISKDCRKGLIIKLDSSINAVQKCLSK